MGLALAGYRQGVPPELRRLIPPGLIAIGAPNYTQMVLSDSFAANQKGAYPAGWTRFGEVVSGVQIDEAGGQGEQYRVFSFPYVERRAGNIVSIYDRAVCSQYVASVNVTFRRRVADSAGLAVAWEDEKNYITIFPNINWKNFTITDRVDGVEQVYLRSGNSTLPIDPGVLYTLTVDVAPEGGGSRLIASISGQGLTSERFIEYHRVGNMVGKVGIATGGPNPPDVYFDNFNVNGACRSTTS
jgi:hypothetical protein